MPKTNRNPQRQARVRALLREVLAGRGARAELARNRELLSRLLAEHLPAIHSVETVVIG